MSLSIGSPAPELRVGKWLQGGPITGFEPGHVYVVEFWATWCGPCRATIPHLSKLAKQHEGRVTVIGVDIWEQDDMNTEAGLGKVKDFVKSMGEKMSYPVATDSPDQYMAQAWMQASGRQGIPSSFVVDGTGKVVWIGHPSGGLDAVLSQLVAGQFDVEASRKKLAEEQEAQAPMQKYRELMKPFMAALKVGDYERALKAIDNIQQELPSQGGAKILRVQAGLSCGHEEDALAAAKEILEDPESKSLLAPLGMTIAEMPDASEAATRAGIAALEKLLSANDHTGYEHILLYGLAQLVARTGDRPRALALCDQAIAGCTQAGDQAAAFLPALDELKNSL